MSDELKACPNRKCRNDRVGTASRVLDETGLSQAFGECPMCGMRGPMVAGVTMTEAEALAREMWNDLPRPLRWTSGFPMASGWWFVQAVHQGRPVDPVVVMNLDDAARMHIIFGPGTRPHVRYAGPIPEPVEPEGGAA